MGKVCESFRKKDPFDGQENAQIQPENENKSEKNNQLLNQSYMSQSTQKTNIDNYIKRPPLKIYDPNKKESIISKLSLESSDPGIEIFKEGGVKNPDYDFSNNDLYNSNLSNQLMNENKNSSQKPLAESISYFEKTNNQINIINYIDFNKPKTFVAPKRPIFPIMQGNTKNNLNKSISSSNTSRINVSLHDSGSAQNAYLYIPKEDYRPIPDLENITENI